MRRLTEALTLTPAERCKEVKNKDNTTGSQRMILYNLPLVQKLIHTVNCFHIHGVCLHLKSVEPFQILQTSALIPTMHTSPLPYMCVWGERDIVPFVHMIWDNGLVHAMFIFAVVSYNILRK